MFCNCVQILIDEMKGDADFWKQVYPKLKAADFGSSHVGLRTTARVSLIEVICEDDLKLAI
ncbi:MAG: hypothetical protein IM620_02835 [Cytophagales bacterium]|nr:hypothetical protein [Cytophagales bacterium]